MANAIMIEPKNLIIVRWIAWWLSPLFLPKTSSSKIALTKSKVAKARVKSTMGWNTSLMSKLLKFTIAVQKLEMHFTNKSNDTKVSMIEIIKYMTMLPSLKVLKYFEGELISTATLKGICKHTTNARSLF